MPTEPVRNMTCCAFVANDAQYSNLKMCWVYVVCLQAFGILYIKDKMGCCCQEKIVIHSLSHCCLIS